MLPTLLVPSPYLTKKQYQKRQDRAARKIHWFLCRKYDFEGKIKLYEHIQEPVLENEKCKFFRVIIIQNKKEIEAKETRPRCVKRIEGTRIPGDQNNNMKKREKMKKYRALKIKLQKLWNVRTDVVLVFIGATRTISEKLEKYLRSTDIPNDILSLQRTTLFGAGFILGRVFGISNTG